MGGSGPGERRGGDEQADTGGDAREAAVADGVAAADGVPADDRVAAAAAELYGADQEAFTDRRKALAAAARTAGDKSAATAIAALRKPTRAAWVVNRLARAEPDAPARLAALAAALRAAEQQKDGPRLRELSAARGALIDALTAEALAAASVPDPPASLRDEVAATLTAALAAPETAAEFAAGTLTKAAHWSGFGSFGLTPAGFGSADLSPADGSGSEPTRTPAPGRPPRDVPAKRDLPSQPGPSRPSRPSHRSRPSRPSQPGDAAGRDQGDSRPRTERRAAGPPDEVAARRAAQERRATEDRRATELQQQLAREAAERAAARQKNYQDVERTVVSAATANAEAEAAEDRLEAEVRDLEERLTQAREDLAAARRRARHAEAAERRARQALDRLPRP